VPRARLEGAGEGLAKLGLARDVALSELSIADREAPVLALEQQCLARYRRVDPLLDQRQEELLLAGEMPVQRAFRVARPAAISSTPPSR
jgi:hypothetical protein